MILVTGATGLVGSAVVRQLLEKGESVRALVRVDSDLSNIKDLDIEFFEGDLRNSNNFGEMFSGCEGLFHLAADYRLWAKNPTDLYRVNCDGTKAIMLSAAKAGVSRIVYTSSVATLGLVPGGEANEETPVKFEDMIGNYKKSKFLAEKFVKELCLSEGVPIVIVNPTTPIGPRDIKPTPTGRMVLEAAAGKIPAYVETGLNLVHVDDVAKGHILAYEKGSIGEKYILGGQNLEFSQILAKIAEITGGRCPKIKLPHNFILPIGVFVELWARIFGNSEPFITVDGIRMAKKKMFFSSKKAESQLGYKSQAPENGLRDAIEWFTQTGRLKV